MNEERIGDSLNEIEACLAQDSRPLISLGYDVYREFDWISQECPSLLLNFKYLC